jgi:hypothetical protein
LESPLVVSFLFEMDNPSMFSVESFKLPLSFEPAVFAIEFAKPANLLAAAEATEVKLEDEVNAPPSIGVFDRDIVWASGKYVVALDAVSIEEDPVPTF